MSSGKGDVGKASSWQRTIGEAAWQPSSLVWCGVYSDDSRKVRESRVPRPYFFDYYVCAAF